MLKSVAVALGALAAGSLMAVAPAGPAHAAVLKCNPYQYSANHNSIAVTCTQGPGTKFWTAIQCTNSDPYILGPKRPYGGTSSIGCNGIGTIVSVTIRSN